MEENKNFNSEHELNTLESEQTNVKVINTNGVNQSVVNSIPVNNLNDVNQATVQQMNPINSNVTNEEVKPIGKTNESVNNTKKKIGEQEIIMYVLMVIVIIFIILLLLKFCSENSGKSIYVPSTTQTKTTTTSYK